MRYLLLILILISGIAHAEGNDSLDVNVDGVWTRYIGTLIYFNEAGTGGIAGFTADSVVILPTQAIPKKSKPLPATIPGVFDVQVGGIVSLHFATCLRAPLPLSLIAYAGGDFYVALVCAAAD